MTNQKEAVFDDLLSSLEPNLTSRDQRYNQLRWKMFKFFEWRRCADPWELADETITRLVKNVQSGTEVQSYSYIYTIANNVFREYHRSTKRDAALIASLPARYQAADPLLDCKKYCFKQLDRDKRELLERYYAGQATSEELAEIMKTSLRNLRLRIHRIKKKLAECCKDCEKNRL
jgi:DNA-directed RNA polymerase specialized sigma24 family protein